MVVPIWKIEVCATGHSLNSIKNIRYFKYGLQVYLENLKIRIQIKYLLLKFKRKNGGASMLINHHLVYVTGSNENYYNIN